MKLSLPTGFVICERIEKMKIARAGEYLLGRRARRYSKAIRAGDCAYLYSSFISCPECGETYPINSAFRRAEGNNDGKLRYRSIPKGIVNDWASLQLSLFEEERCKELVLCRADEDLSVFDCPYCGRHSRLSVGQREVELGFCENSIFVKCERTGDDEALLFECNMAVEPVAVGPTFETVNFDLHLGEVRVSVEDSAGNTLCSGDVAADPEILAGGAFIKALSHKTVNRSLKRLFVHVWGGALPYMGGRLDISDFIRMTAFVGYPLEFYTCVPFEEGSYRIEESFRKISKDLHYSFNIEKVYNSSRLPQKKSVRRTIFSDPGLIFYSDEICDIWECLSDCNLLCRFLKWSRRYEVLSALHTRPGMIDYVQDICRIVGGISFLKSIENNWEKVMSFAIDYCSMSEAMRKKVISETKGKLTEGVKMPRDPGYSLPMKMPEKQINDCCVDGYTFFLLKNSNDYYFAARRLDNCLCEWRPHHAPVVCVRRRDEYLAAIEIQGELVVQIKGHNNCTIGEDGPLFKAFLKWIGLCGLKRHCDIEPYFYE
ncbi:MAG: hypothetical protein IJA52_02375 [Clostridia bacterium]|nr:hypothetical protein [Clostridia bacterium]